MNPESPTALVTGASRGIGKAIAETLAAADYQVLLTYVSKEQEAQAVVQGITQRGGTAKAFRLDMADAASISAFFQNEVKDKFRLDVLVNNAGITKDNYLIRMKDEDFDRVIEVNLKGVFICMREAAKIMSKQRSGRIVNISSVVGQTGNPGQTNYCAAKAGVIGMTKAVAKELAGRGITVNAVAPGFIETDMTQNLPEDVRSQYLAGIPLKRFGHAQDVAEAVAFLASNKAAYITGQVLAVNGGMYC